MFPNDEIVLKVTDIPPLDVFYNTLHKVVVRKQRKRRRIETPPGNEVMEVVWKDTPSNPIENLTRLSKFAGAYTTALMDQATEVSILVQEKDDKIMHLQQKLYEERSSLNQKVEQQLLKF